METNGGIVYYSIDDEIARLKELDSLRLVHSPPEQSFDRITKIVSNFFKMPIVLISLITADQQWFKSCIGLPEDLLNSRGTEREAAFCQYVVAHKEPLIVRNALKDGRFSNNRLVTMVNGIRFYAGAPLITKMGNILGTLCVIDEKSRRFSKKDMKNLQEFASIVMSEIDLREEIRVRVEMEESLRRAKEEAVRANQAKSQFMTSMSHEIRNPLNAIVGMSHILLDIIKEEEPSRYLSIVDNNAQNLLKMINNLLDFTEADKPYHYVNINSPETKKRLLLVEDNLDNQFLIQAFMKKEPYQLDIASNGIEAVAKASEHHYDAILMDMHMPIMDGYAATKKIRQWEKEQNKDPVPIIALTAYTMASDHQKAMQAGCSDYLTKPINKKVLMECLQSSTS